MSTHYAYRPGTIEYRIGERLPSIDRDALEEIARVVRDMVKSGDVYDTPELEEEADGTYECGRLDGRETR
jgi:hypothetical protein